MPTWRFHTVPVLKDKAIRYEWTWEAVPAEGPAEKAALSFASVSECIQDARRCGFTGEIDLSNGFRVGERSDTGLLVGKRADSDAFLFFR